MKFKLDENLPTEAVAVLLEAGHDAMSVLDQDLGGEADDRIAEICLAENRVLLTFDIDFANIRTYPPCDFGGIVVFRLVTQEKAHLTEILNKLLEILETASPARQLLIVEEDRIRIRE